MLDTKVDLELKTDPQLKTDEEIHRMALEEWMGILDQLWIAVGKPVDPERLDVYRKNLVRVPFGLLENAVDRVMSGHTYNSVPTLGEIWAAIRKELGNPYDLDQAIERWSEERWNRIIYRFGGAPSVAVETEGE